MSKPHGLFLLFLITAFAALPAAGQAPPDETDTQSWNDLQVTVPVSKRVDVLLTTMARIGHNVSQLDEYRVGGGLAFRLSKSVTFSPSYTYIETRSAAGRFRTEHRYSLKGSYKFPIKKKFSLSHRSTYEYRVRSSGNTWRYRPSLTFEHPLPERWLGKSKIFVTEEIFYVSTTKKFSRNRFSVGVSKSLNSHLTLDIFYLRQNDSFSQPGDLHVIGTTWRVHL
jgi:hypothetical protein